MKKSDSGKRRNFHLSHLPLISLVRCGIVLLKEPNTGNISIEVKMEGAVTQTGTVTPTSSRNSEDFTTSTLAYDRTFIHTAPGILVLAEIVFGLMVWTLIGGTEYFRVPAFGWVLFVAILYWVLTLIFLILYLTVVKRIPRVPWKTVGLCFNGSATVMYAVATAVDAASISKGVRGRYNYNCWTASTIFALLVTLCYAGSTYFSFKSWRLREEEQ
ncbi:hypothetical protein DPEC_G00140720 [Dallia pectoralis]|uniref:Uncharacterized protein n=1 Tax=Dallia pectoralis TaxID=75939 RepID=A0ACC2GML4_DALPE|nr:hypothetical protein DPEC_G00140720 [Dallia pectoralis]